jgi:hypothetical protein
MEREGRSMGEVGGEEGGDMGGMGPRPCELDCSFRCILETWLAPLSPHILTIHLSSLWEAPKGPQSSSATRSVETKRNLSPPPSPQQTLPAPPWQLLSPPNSPHPLTQVVSQRVSKSLEESRCKRKKGRRLTLCCLQRSHLLLPLFSLLNELISDGILRQLHYPLERIHSKHFTKNPQAPSLPVTSYT